MDKRMKILAVPRPIVYYAQMQVQTIENHIS